MTCIVIAAAARDRNRLGSWNETLFYRSLRVENHCFKRKSFMIKDKAHSNNVSLMKSKHLKRSINFPFLLIWKIESNLCRFQCIQIYFTRESLLWFRHRQQDLVHYDGIMEESKGSWQGQKVYEA